MVTRLTALLTVFLIALTSMTAQTLPGSGITTKSVPFSGSIYNTATQEYVDITGFLNVVRAIKYGSDETAVAVFSGLAPNVTAIGRSSGIQYCTNGTVTVTRHLPPGPVSNTGTVGLTFPLYPCSGTQVSADLIEYTLVVWLVTLAASLATPQ
jgi:hypothetical protein